MTGSFPHVVRFGVTERGDVVAGPPGRGRYGPDEIQGADCPPGTAAPDVEPARTPGIEVRELPGRVHFQELPQGDPFAVPVGLGGDAAEVCTLDLTGPGGGLLVAGPRRSGVSTTLTVLAATATAAEVPVLRAWLRPAAPVPASRRAACRAVDVDVRLGFHELRSRLVDHCGPLLLIADDADSWPEEGQDLLERFVTLAGTGQYVALGSRLDRATRCHRGPIAEVAALRTGILLHADSADGSLLDTVLPRRRGQLPAGRGHLVLAGHAVPLQVACL